MGLSRNVVNISKTLVPNLVILVLFLVPTIAEASIFSFIANLFVSNQAEAQEIEQNSQNIALLQAVNSPSPSPASSSDEIRIVGGTSLVYESPASSEEKKASADQISIYVVRTGDTLPAIAKMFDVSVNTIKWANDLKSNTIKEGQTLVIMPISGIQHVVKSGDTLQGIAKLHKGDLEEILQFNNLAKDAKLVIGDVIFIPDGEAAAVSTKVSVNVGKSGSSAKVIDGYYMRPIVGGVRTQGVHGHNGVDLASSYGANIVASAKGQVIIARSSGYNGGYGLYVVIKHANGTQTLYGHLSSVLVSVGETVNQGQVIGKMGSTGKSTGTHLHFEIRGARNPF